LRKCLSAGNEELLRLFIIAAACVGAVLTTIFSLTHGIFEVFPFLYILPIILMVYFYPKQTVLFSLGISLVYIGLIYFYGFTNPHLIAIATAWFAIFVTIGVVASSYANQLIEERGRIRNILENSQDGIFCFDIESEEILEINQKCASWLKYDRAELIGRSLESVWSEPAERKQFVERVRSGFQERESEGIFRSKDGTLIRLVTSAVLVSHNRVLCSAIDITGNKIMDEEIRRTLEDLEEQVRARTAHLEKINEELQAEILEQRRFERTIMSRPEDGRRETEEDK